MSLNQVTIIGRITKDPELKESKNNIKYCKFNVAINRGKDKTGSELGADFIPCTVWNENAKNLSLYIKKGNEICVLGSWKTGTYESEGQTIYTHDLSVAKIDYLAGNKKSDTVSKEPENSTPIVTKENKMEMEELFQDIDDL